MDTHISDITFVINHLFTIIYFRMIAQKVGMKSMYFINSTDENNSSNGCHLWYKCNVKAPCVYACWRWVIQWPCRAGWTGAEML